MIRLNRFIALAGVTSRRGADALIEEGVVKINNSTVTKLGTEVDPAKDVVKVRGRVLRLPAKHTYVILNKPRGVVTTARDEFERRTVLDVVKVPGVRLFPVGRLDRDSEGLLLLTDDGELALRLAHPRYRQEKEYKVWLDGFVTDEQIKHLREGIVIEGKRTLPAGVWIKGRHQKSSQLKFKLGEGRKRQIRLMCEALGLRVVRLVRVAEGPLILGDLGMGQWRTLTDSEAARLRRHVGLDK